jgi:hypothetical protein
MHSVAGVGVLGFGRAVAVCVALPSTEVAAVIGSSPCFLSLGGFLDANDNFMVLDWLWSGARAGVLPLSGGEVHGGEASCGKTRGEGGCGI